MFFTQDDYKKIQQWLIKNSVKDTEFDEANIPFNGEETITIVQGNQNKKVFLKDLIAQVFNLGISDFVNITDKYDAPNISLEEAIRLIPSRARKEGQVITFLDREDHWHIYQFKGALNQWNVLDTWEDLFDWEKLIIDSILPDEEDLTKSPADENGNSYLSLKDREYNPEDFSGLGRIILRKNVVEVEDPIYGKVKKNVLYQDMLTQSNTIYECRYDFDLNGQNITLPDNSYIEYNGGSISNGNIIDNAKGLNKIILRKNIENDKNILTQSMINKPNTIYIIQYDFDLNGEEITISEGCVLDFQGGSLSNGVIKCNKTTINAAILKIFNAVKFKGTLLNDHIYVNWFGATGDGTYDSTKEIQECIDSIRELDSKTRTCKSFVFTDKEYIISNTIHVHRELSYCALFGNMPLSLDAGIAIISKNINAPMFRFYTVGSAIHNLKFRYDYDSADNENKICLLFKATDDLNTEDYTYSDVDASIYNCSFGYCNIGINYWGVQMDCHDNIFANTTVSSIKIDYFPKAYREHLGPARCYRIHKNNFHANPYYSVLIWNNTDEQGYNFHITENFSDCFSLLFKGNLKYSIIENNNLSVITAGAVIDSDFIENTVINGNFFNRRKEYPYGEVPTNYIKSASILKSVISGNHFGDSGSSSLFFKEANGLVITNNMFGRTQGGREVNDETGEDLDFNTAILLSYNKISDGIVISNNTFAYYKITNVVTFYSNFTNNIVITNNTYVKHNNDSTFENEKLNLRYKSYPLKDYANPEYLRTNISVLQAFDFTNKESKLKTGMYLVNPDNCIGSIPVTSYFRLFVISNESAGTETRLAFPTRWEGRGIYIQKVDSSITGWKKINNITLEGFTESSESNVIQPGDVGTTDGGYAIILRAPDNTWVRADGSPIKNYGLSSERPNTKKLGTVYYDTDLEMPVFKQRQNSNIWCTAYGYSAEYNIKGTTEERPVMPGVSIGFQYFDTTLNKPIWWTGSKWVDATGADI